MSTLALHLTPPEANQITEALEAAGWSRYAQLVSGGTITEGDLAGESDEDLAGFIKDLHLIATGSELAWVARVAALVELLAQALGVERYADIMARVYCAQCCEPMIHGSVADDGWWFCRDAASDESACLDAARDAQDERRARELVAAVSSVECACGSATCDAMRDLS